MKPLDRAVTFGLIVGRRGFFNPQLAREGRKQLLSKLDARGHLCQNGFEHHVAMARTHCAEVLQEAVSKYLGWDLYRHK